MDNRLLKSLILFFILSAPAFAAVDVLIGDSVSLLATDQQKNKTAPQTRKLDFYYQNFFVWLVKNFMNYQKMGAFSRNPSDWFTQSESPDTTRMNFSILSEVEQDYWGVTQLVESMKPDKVTYYTPLKDFCALDLGNGLEVEHYVSAKINRLKSLVEKLPGVRIEVIEPSNLYSWVLDPNLKEDALASCASTHVSIFLRRFLACPNMALALHQGMFKSYVERVSTPFRAFKTMYVDRVEKLGLPRVKINRESVHLSLEKKHFSADCLHLNQKGHDLLNRTLMKP